MSRLLFQINTDMNPEVENYEQVYAIPAIYFYKNNEKLHSIVGSNTAEIQTSIEKYKWT